MLTSVGTAKSIEAMMHEAAMAACRFFLVRSVPDEIAMLFGEWGPMYCSKCGTEIQPGAKFCPKCGAPAPQVASNDGTSEVEADAGSSSSLPTGPNTSLFIGLIIGAAAVVVGLGIWAWFAFFAPYPIDESTFPDTAVRTVVSNTVDSDGNGEVSRDEAAAVTSFTVDGAVNLDGLDRFPNTREIAVKGSALSSADIGPFESLESFSAPDSSLATLDVSRNPSLDVLDVPDSTQVTGIEATQLVETWLPVSLESSYFNTETGEFTVSTRNEIERDSHGNPTKRIVKSISNGSVSSTTTTEFEYNDAGRVATSTQSYESSYSSGGSVDTSTYSYDDAGRLISIATDSSSYGNEEAYAYDDAGRLSTITYTYSSSSEPQVTKIEYDDQGRATAAKFGDNGLYATWAYDDQGRLSNCGDFYADAMDLTDHSLTYDEQGRVTQVECTPGPPINPDFETYRSDFDTSVTYSYDESGRMISGESNSDYSGDSSENTKVECELDNGGRLIRTVFTRTSTYDGRTNTDKNSKSQTYGRYFIPMDDEEDKTYIYLAPTYDSLLYSVYIKDPEIPVVPGLDASLVAFEYGTIRDYMS